MQYMIAAVTILFIGYAAITVADKMDPNFDSEEFVDFITDFG